jgi:hypothetical protein
MSSLMVWGLTPELRKPLLTNRTYPAKLPAPQHDSERTRQETIDLTATPDVAPSWTPIGVRRRSQNSPPCAIAASGKTRNWAEPRAGIQLVEEAVMVGLLTYFAAGMVLLLTSS